MPFCTVCLNNENDPTLKDVNLSNTENGITIIVKLRTCVPEVEWEETAKICFICSEQLNYVCSFRTKCVRSYLTRKKYLSSDYNLQRNRSLEQSNDSGVIEDSNEEILCISDDDNDEVEDVTSGPEPEQPSSSTDINLSFCKYCGENFDNDTILTNHINSKHDIGSEDRSNKESEDYSLLEVEEEPHSDNNYDDDDDDCVIVGVDTVNSGKDPIEEKIKNKICYVCGKTFSTYSPLYSHFVEKHFDQLLSCDKCPIKFMNELRLNRHRRKIHETCETFKIQETSHQENHEKMYPKRKRIFTSSKRFNKCPKCPLYFEFLFNLKIHMAKEHKSILFVKQNNCLV